MDRGSPIATALHNILTFTRTCLTFNFIQQSQLVHTWYIHRFETAYFESVFAPQIEQLNAMQEAMQKAFQVAMEKTNRSAVVRANCRALVERIAEGDVSPQQVLAEVQQHSYVSFLTGLLEAAIRRQCIADVHFSTLVLSMLAISLLKAEACEREFGSMLKESELSLRSVQKAYSKCFPKDTAHANTCKRGVLSSHLGMRLHRVPSYRGN